MTWSISGSVGRRGHNLRADVTTVQTLLTEIARASGDPRVDPLGIDGVIASPPSKSDTVRAIEAFQQGYMTAPDGRVDVGGRTWARLVQAGGAVHVPTTPASSGFSFPFPSLPSAKWRWNSGQRRFAADRSGGKRAHAGCDLYYPVGTWIYAVADGEVVEAPAPFYAQTDALVVDHGDHLIRYGEIQPGLSLPRGTMVRPGQRIARVGRLVGVKVPSAMLHFEVYDKSSTGPLTVTNPARSARRADGVPFLRRKDLVDPTSLLDSWAISLPLS